MNILEVIIASVLGILLYASQLSNYNPERQIVSSSSATSVMTQVAGKISTICEQSDGQCLVAGTALTSTAALTSIAGWMPVVPVDPMSKKAPALNVVADTNDANLKHWSLDFAGKYAGDHIQDIPVYSGGTYSTPVSGTEYYLHYDPCVGQTFASTTATTTPIQCS